MNLLNEDNVVHVFLNKLGDIVIANLLFIFSRHPSDHYRTGTDCTLSLYDAYRKGK